MVPPFLVAERPAYSDGTEAIGSLDNARGAFRATSEKHIHTEGSGGNFTGFIPGGVSVCAPCLPVGLGPATFLVQRLSTYFP